MITRATVTSGVHAIGPLARKPSASEMRGEIVFTKNTIACYLRPVGEGRLIKSKLIIEVRHDVVSARDHLARSFGKPRLVAINQRQTPCAGDVKKDAGEKKQRVIAYCGFQVSTQNSNLERGLPVCVASGVLLC